MKLIRVALAAVLVFAFAHRSSASLLYDITTGTGTTYNLAGNWGDEFQANQSITVGALGVWDDGKASLPSGIQVGLWDLDTDTQVASVTVTNSSAAVASASSLGQWLFTNISGGPVTLSLDHTYALGYFNDVPTNSSVGLIPFRYQVNDTFSSEASFIVALGGSGETSSLEAPTSAGGTIGYFGPNFDTSPVGVPEPATISLFALAAVCLGAYGLRRRRNFSS